MKGIGPLLAVALLGVGGFLFLTGKIPGYGQGTGEVSGAGQDAVEGARGAAEQFIGTPQFYLALVASALATLGMVTWKKIGGWGRATVIIIATVAVTAWLVR